MKCIPYEELLRITSYPCNLSSGMLFLELLSTLLVKMFAKMSFKVILSTVNSQMMRTPCRTIRFCVNTSFSSKVLSLNLSRYLSQRSTSEALFNFGLMVFNLNIPVIYFETSTYLFIRG